MRSHLLRGWLAVGAILALPVMAHAQEAALSGTVSDTTGGALPGVTVRAVHEASGNSFEAVTDARGDYRLAVRVGAYRLTAELAGFAPVTRTLELLVGQQAVVNLQMGVSGVREAVTVTGEAPLLDVTQSSLGGNIDPRQLQELPVQGRNWMDLVALAPGSRGNAIVEAPNTVGTGLIKPGGDFEINVDGQQLTQLLSAAVAFQPHFSRDAIAEFEFLSSRFDATQGRASGVQVNAITKSGTNTPSGSFAGYFRDDRFNGADFVARRVLPYQDQQLSGTFGGPLRKDKLHFFANYEYERNPTTAVYTTPFPHFNVDQSGINTEKKGGVKLDAQFSPRTRLALRWSDYRSARPISSGSGTSIPSTASRTYIGSTQFLGTLNQVLSNRAVNEVKVGFAGYWRDTGVRINNHNSPFFRDGRLGGNGPRILLRSFTVGGAGTFPNDNTQDTYSVRDDFTYSFNKGGRHTAKLGAEYLHQKMSDLRCIICEGELTATAGAIPTNIESLFPDQFDVSTWNLAPLSSISTRWRQAFGSTFLATGAGRETSAFWVQDDWTLSPRLTLNLGLRYDLEFNAFVNDVAVLPFRPGNQPNDTNNVGPRLGFNFSLNDRTVMRGGVGKYFATTISAYATEHAAHTLTLETPNDGRPDFASNPYNGPAPTYASLLAKLCTPALVPGCIRPEIPSSTTATIYAPGFTIPYSIQSSIGLQRQLGTTMSIETDYVYIGLRDVASEELINLSYNPATGANYPFSDISKRPFPQWGHARMYFNGGRSNSNALQTAFTKRFSGRWQASGNYTLSVVRDASMRPVQWTGSGFELVPFPTAPDLGGEYGLTIGDQRHRAVVNGLWQLRYGVQLSGLYAFGSGERYQTSYSRNVDVRQQGATTNIMELRARPDGTIVLRNNFVGKPVHRVDLRLQRRFPLGGRAGIDGMLEVFNVFNHANYGSYVTEEASRNNRQPQQNSNVAYAPRTLQLGFRFAF